MTRLAFDENLLRRCVTGTDPTVHLTEVRCYYFYDRTLAGIWALPNGQRLFGMAADYDPDTRADTDILVPLSRRREQALHNNCLTLRQACASPEAGWFTLTDTPHQPLVLSERYRTAMPHDLLPKPTFRVRDFDFRTWVARQRRKRRIVK